MLQRPSKRRLAAVTHKCQTNTSSGSGGLIIQTACPQPFPDASAQDEPRGCGSEPLPACARALRAFSTSYKLTGTVNALQLTPGIINLHEQLCILLESQRKIYFVALDSTFFSQDIIQKSIEYRAIKRIWIAEQYLVFDEKCLSSY